ncbi:CD20-like domain-containing protein [Dellaglioa sp. P0083]|uniref:CD20-like domain-containing protein n=1 Tax=Dellaglioa kimchii TaxID=3344667 RepID=UPI0038D4DB6A
MSEKKVLGILAIVFGGIALAFSWVPIINNMSAFLGLVGALLGVIGLFVNRKNKKTLAIIGTVLSIVSIIIVLMTQSAYSNALDKIDPSVSSSDSNSEKKSKSLTIDYNDYSFSKSKDYSIDVSDNNWANTKVKVDKVTVYKLAKNYTYKSTNDGTFNIEGFVKLHFSIAPGRDIAAYPTQGTAIFDNGEQHEADSSETWDGDISKSAVKDGSVVIPVKSLKDVTSLTNIRFKFDANYDTDDYDDSNSTHHYDLNLKL